MTNETCVVEDAEGARASQTVVARSHVWLRDALYVMDFADGAAVLDLQTGERTDLGVSWSDGRVRIVDETGVHDFGAQASARAVLRLPVWGRQETQLLFKTVGNTQALELWHAPSGRHVRVSNQVFATPYEHLCGPDLVRGVGADHPGLYSFVEPAPEGDGTGEFFVGEADLLTPPRSLGKVKLASCRKPRASLDGVSVGFMELDSAASKLTRARLRQVTAA